MAFVDIASVIARLLFKPAIGATDDRSFDDAAIDRLAKWRVANDVLKDLPPIVLRCGTEIELRHNEVTTGLSDPGWSGLSIRFLLPATMKIP